VSQVNASEYISLLDDMQCDLVSIPEPVIYFSFDLRCESGTQYNMNSIYHKIINSLRTSYNSNNISIYCPSAIVDFVA